VILWCFLRMGCRLFAERTLSLSHRQRHVVCVSVATDSSRTCHLDISIFAALLAACCKAVHVAIYILFMDINNCKQNYIIVCFIFKNFYPFYFSFFMS